ncbi:hypothetical protein BG08_2654 [Bacillus thuringiensis serovar kurstaki]|jgi:hypothetical protein|uniref:Uncharacterized protein n=2 Tax=Bacillus cereus TaxID=1396 RepID=A0A9W5VF77_BACCE|nr:hypothetical protein HD73_3425 [Bacillus thuringiensis serovar kurstaki str. HD73]AIM31216.1 hypothetical protein DF16_orf02801 [Bacillus thuringiensis serovar kurstaki str. YBT-1520]AJK44284.1 hypothetical protein BG08_2654 [Bacillus thuringiensis serovar kurstaki]EEL64951.1 hypothetical protein bcere0025_22580 [Bacillus cereus F65185]EEM53328.1 hypothetical protein bthur0006_23060 [Bacillus thuringiensis serovar kurstaki str. T03a001]EJV89061.1 hypothetical protein IG1_01718 [Bacillus cer
MRKYDRKHIPEVIKLNKMKRLRRKVAVVAGATIYVTE